MGKSSRKGKQKTLTRPSSPHRDLGSYFTRSQPRRSSSLPPGLAAAAIAPVQWDAAAGMTSGRSPSSSMLPAAAPASPRLETAGDPLQALVPAPLPPMPQAVLMARGPTEDGRRCSSPASCSIPAVGGLLTQVPGQVGVPLDPAVSYADAVTAAGLSSSSSPVRAALRASQQLEASAALRMSAPYSPLRRASALIPERSPDGHSCSSLDSCSVPAAGGLSSKKLGQVGALSPGVPPSAGLPVPGSSVQGDLVLCPAPVPNVPCLVAVSEGGAPPLAQRFLLTSTVPSPAGHSGHPSLGTVQPALDWTPHHVLHDSSPPMAFYTLPSQHHGPHLALAPPSPCWRSGSSWGSLPGQPQAPSPAGEVVLAADSPTPALDPQPGTPSASSPGLPPSLRGMPPIFGTFPLDPAVPAYSPAPSLGLSGGIPPPLAADRLITLADLRSLIESLPTKTDFSSLAKQVVAECKQEFAQLRTDLSAVSARVDAVETVQESSTSSIQALQVVVQKHTDQLFTLQQHLDDVENRNRRNNVRLRGLPEAVGPEGLYPAVLAIFNDLLDRAPDAHIELDRVHRALRPPQS